MNTTANGTQLLDKTAQDLPPAETGLSEWPMPPADKGLGDHPLWQMYLEELEASRQADIAEANRLADLEMGMVARTDGPPASANSG